MNQKERIARNLELAQKFYDGYRYAAKRGSYEGWSVDDIADGAVMFSTWTGEVPFLKQVSPLIATLEMQAYLKVLPDITAEDFEAWPTEDGCVWCQKFCGHSADGTYYEVWECDFIWTNGEGKITRWNFFDDWMGMPAVVKLATGLSPEGMNPESYMASIKGHSPDLAEKLQVEMLKAFGQAT